MRVKTKLRILIALVAAVMLASCAKVHYEGIEHAQTTTVVVFNDYDEIDPDQKYEIMGILTITGGKYSSESGVQNKVVEEARKRGADAVVLGEARKSIEGVSQGGSIGSGYGMGGGLKMEKKHNKLGATLIKFR